MRFVQVLVLASLSCGFAHQLTARKVALSVDASVDGPKDKHDKPAAHAKNADVDVDASVDAPKDKHDRPAEHAKKVEKVEKPEKVQKALKTLTNKKASQEPSTNPVADEAVSDEAGAEEKKVEDEGKEIGTEILSDERKAQKEGAATTKDQTSQLLLAYGIAMIAMVVCVSAMFYPMGVAVVCQVVLYVSCLAFVKIALKFVYAYDFDYPKFITSVHLLVSSTAAFIVLAHRNITAGKSIPVPTRDELFFGIIPIASTFGFSIASENSALVFVSAAFSEVVASTNPVMSFSLTWLLGLGANFALLPPIGVVILGCAISVEGEMYFSTMGLALLLLSVFFRGLKAVMQQKLMTGETKEKFDPVTLMAWTCMFAFLVVTAYSVLTEGAEPWNALAGSKDLGGLTAALLASAVIACTLNISALFVIRQLGAVGMQMVSQMKSLLVVIGGIALLGESFTNVQKVGFGIVLSGVWWYSRIVRQGNEAKAAAAEKAALK